MTAASDRHYAQYLDGGMPPDMRRDLRRRAREAKEHDRSYWRKLKRLSDAALDYLERAAHIPHPPKEGDLAAASEGHEKRQRITPPSEVCEARYEAFSGPRPMKGSPRGKRRSFEKQSKEIKEAEGAPRVGPKRKCGLAARRPLHSVFPMVFPFATAKDQRPR
jgi:hypothetical protein